MENKFFMHSIRRTSGTFTKGIEIHDTLESAQGSFHATLGNFGYGRNTDTDFVQCEITDTSGATINQPVTWTAQATQQPKE